LKYQLVGKAPCSFFSEDSELLGTNWEHLLVEQVHGLSLRSHTSVRIDFESCCQVRVPELSLRNL
jgi:hypothetical protein